MWNLISIHLEIVLVLVQDSRTDCPERTVGSEIILDKPDGTPRGDEGQVEARFGPFGDSVSVGAR